MKLDDSANYAADNYTEISADVLAKWPCSRTSCVDCEEQFFSIGDQCRTCMLYTRKLTDPEARNIADTLRLEQHGDVIMSRWRKRSKDKRAELLLRARPNLPEDPYTEFRLTQPNGGKYDWKKTRTAKYRAGALIPYLCLSTLKDNPSVLLALLHNRTQHSLEEWAPFDLYQFRDSWKIGLLDVEFSPLCILLHGSGYGDVVPFQEGAAHRGDIIGFPRAQLLLEAQSSLMEFLKKAIDFILEGANLDKSSSAKWNAMCEEGFRASGDVAEWSPYTYQPFSPPPTFDIDAIIETAQARVRTVADHLEMLQTDRSYLRRYIRMCSQGEIHKDGRWSMALGFVDADIAGDVTSLYWWMCVRDEAKFVRDVRRRFRDQICRGSPLPPKYDRALASLEVVLVNMMNMRGGLYWRDIPQRLGFTKYFRFITIPGGVEIAKKDDWSMKNQFQDDPLFWCLSNLCGKPDTPTGIAHDRLFRFLDDHLATSSAAESARLDQIMLDYLSDHAANHQLLLAVRLHRPQNKTGDKDVFRKTEDRRAWRTDMGKLGFIKSGFEARGKLLQQFYQTSTPGTKKDAAWIVQDEALQSTMQAYWDAFRREVKHEIKDVELLQILQADTDPGHLAALEARRQSIRDEAASRARAPQQTPRVVNEPERTRIEPLPIREKTKSRPSANTDVDSNENSEQSAHDFDVHREPVPAIPQQTIPTTKRAQDVFSKMFADDAESASKKGSSWDQFVHAMKDVGVSVRNGAGSAVVFELANKDRIVFHRPHPEAKIDAILLRAMGKRLTKWFGWTLDSFVPVTAS